MVSGPIDGSQQPFNRSLFDRMNRITRYQLEHLCQHAFRIAGEWCRRLGDRVSNSLRLAVERREKEPGKLDLGPGKGRQPSLAHDPPNRSLPTDQAILNLDYERDQTGAAWKIKEPDPVPPASKAWFRLEHIEIFELLPPEPSLKPQQQQSLVYCSDLELGETVRMALKDIERVKPGRVVFDSLSEIRLLSQDSLRCRRQVLALKSYFPLENAPVLMLDDLTSEQNDLYLHSISHADLRLEQIVPACMS